jgi:hypothetical protein
VALEVKKIEQGLLTYALVQNGFRTTSSNRRQADLDENEELTLKEWLQYAEKRVPGVYEDILTGKVKAVGKGVIDLASWESTSRRAQTPSLFDFRRAGPEPAFWRSAR